MDQLTNFGMKNSLNLPWLADKYFNSLGDENDEPINTYTDPFMRHLVRNSMMGWRWNSFIRLYKSEDSDEVFNIISNELDFIGNIWDFR